jgi:DmsE family decaheme c-type cytochrome
MNGWVSVGLTNSAVNRSVCGLDSRITVRKSLSTAAIAALVYGSLFGSPTARAEESSVSGSAYSTLRNYVQEIGPKDIQSVSVGKTDEDDAFAVLRDFARQLPDGQSTSVKSGHVRVAADNAFDALREFLQKQNGNQSTPAPAEIPKQPATSPKSHQSEVAAVSVGTKVCLGCHTSQATTFEHTLMGRLQKQGKLQCESCHGPGSEHVRLGGGRGVGGIISFRKDDTSRTAKENNAICLGCHERGDRNNWQGSTHESRDLMCTNCHTVMKAVSRKNQLKTVFEPDTCFQCHKDRRAQMLRSSHMPMREGKVVCSDCHNPHGSITEAMLKKDSINDVCYTCHAEKRGPFLFEHSPVRENCDNCHEPHGSVNEASLKLSRPRLCFECHQFGHAANNGPFAVTTMARSCNNCHTAIHGSNSPAGGKLQR